MTNTFDKFAPVVIAFAILVISSLPAEAAIGPAPYAADLVSLRTWIIVAAVFLIFACIVACGALFLSQQYGKAVMAGVGIVIGAGIIASALNLTTGLSAGLSGGIPT